MPEGGGGQFSAVKIAFVTTSSYEQSTALSPVSHYSAVTIVLSSGKVNALSREGTATPVQSMGIQQ